MAELSDAARAALKYWAQIEAGAQARLTTAQLWDSIRLEATEQGLAGPGVSALGVGQLRSYAASIRNASATLGKAIGILQGDGIDSAIDSSQLSTAPWSRVQAEMNTLAKYQVRFEYQSVDAAGQTQSQWMTQLFRGAIPATVGELLDSMQTYGQLAGTAPQGDFAGFGDIQILAV